MLQKRQDELAKSHKKQVEQLEAISKLSATSPSLSEKSPNAILMLENEAKWVCRFLLIWALAINEGGTKDTTKKDTT